MVAPVGGFNITSTLGTTGVNWRKLDIVDKIYNVDPTTAPFFESIDKNVTVRSRQHDWQTRTLQTRALNAMFEGADFTFKNLANPTRVTNYTQILEHGVEVSRSAAKESYYGTGTKTLMKEQIDLRTVEHRNDIEWNLINATFAMGTTAGAQTMRGLRASITTNTTNALGVTLTETLFVDRMAIAWTLSGITPDTVLTGVFNQKIINMFSSLGATRWVDTTTREIVNQVLQYNSSFGSAQIMLCRDLTTTALATSGSELLAYNRSWNHVGWFDKTFIKPVLVDVADADRMVIISELTLQHDNEKTSWKWIGASG